MSAEPRDKETPPPLYIDRLVFARRCMRYVTEASKTNTRIIITKDGQPYVVLEPL